MNDVKLIRAYIQSKEDAARKNNTLNDDLRNWIEWARKKADWYDPHVEAYDDLLNEVSRVTLAFKTG